MRQAQSYEPFTTTEMIEDLEEKKEESERRIREMGNGIIETGISFANRAEFMLPGESEKVNDLLEALAKASGEFKPVKQTGINKYSGYKYTTLDDMIAATDEGLRNQNIRIVHQGLPIERDYWLLVTTIRHGATGQWMASYTPIDPEPTPEKGLSAKQEWGKNLTYSKKYQLGCLLNLGSEDDTDGAIKPTAGDAKANEPASQDPSKRKQSPAEIKSWAMLNELGIDQAAWKKDMYEKYKVKSTTELDPKVWSKISKALEEYQKFILLICDHWQCVSQDLREFLVYKFGHKIGESYDVLHEALSTENGKMAELFSAFSEWKEMPEEEAEAEPEPEKIDMDRADSEAPESPEPSEEPAEGSESPEMSEEKKLLAQIREVLVETGHDNDYINGRMHGLEHQKAPALEKALVTARKQLANANGNGKA